MRFSAIVLTCWTQLFALLAEFLFSSCGESGTIVSDWVHLSGRFDSGIGLLYSQLQRVDLG